MKAQTGKRIYADVVTYTFDLTFAAAGGTLEIPQNLSTSGPFELMGISHNMSSDDFFFNIYDGGSRSELFNDELPASCIAGNGPRQFIPPVSYIFPANRETRIRATNGTTIAGNTGSITLIGATLKDPESQPGRIVKYPSRTEIKRADYFGRLAAYGVEMNFAGNDRIDAAMQIYSDAPFEAFYLMRSHTAAFDLQITDAYEGVDMFKGMVPSANVCGSAQYPSVLPYTKVFPPAGTVLVSGVDTSGAANAGWVVLIGADLERIN